MKRKAMSSKVNEVAFSNQIYEFINFYNKHRNICNEIAGLKDRVYYVNRQEKSIEISRINFDKAIKGLWSFVVNNLHYIVDKNESIALINEVNQLQEDYNNNEDYKRLRKKEEEEGKKNLTTNTNLEFNLLYFNYVLRCFNLADRLNRSLQKSLMVSTVEIKKAIKYQDLNSFYENLSKYREEISNDLGNFELENLVDHFKRILGYFYSYKMMIGVRESKFIEDIIKDFIQYISKRDVMKLIEASKDKYIVDNKKVKVNKITGRIKNVLMWMYVLTNTSLSEKNILPKITESILIDKTLI